MTPDELTKRLAGARIDPVYLVTGEESWLVDETLAAFRRHVVPADAGMLNLHLCSGTDATPAALAMLAQTLPAFAPYRLIIVRDADRLHASDELTAYSRNPSPTTCLVFVMAKPDRRKAWIQALLGTATPVTCDPLPASRLPGWITTHARSRGLSLDHDTIAYVQERSGGSLRSIIQQLDQLALQPASHGSPVIERSGEIRAGVQPMSVFEWAHAVSMGHTERSLAGLHRLLHEEAPLLLLSILIGQWRKMVRYAALANAQTPAAQMAKTLGIPPFAVTRLMQAVRRRTLGELVSGLTWCLETDAALKGGALPGPLALERLVMMLGQGRSASRRPHWPFARLS